MAYLSGFNAKKIIRNENSFFLLCSENVVDILGLKIGFEKMAGK